MRSLPFLVLLLIALPAPAQKRLDALGDPLPDGAVARLGTTRLCPGVMVSGLAFSPDGKRLAIWGRAVLMYGRDRLVIADVATGKDLRIVELPPCVLVHMRWLGNGRGLALVRLDVDEYFVWEFTDPAAKLPERQNPILNATKHGAPRSAAFSPDGRWVAIGRHSHDGSPQPIELREVAVNRPLRDLRLREPGRQDGPGVEVAFSADGRLLFALTRPMSAPGTPAGHARLAAYEVESGQTLGEFNVALPLDIDTATRRLSQRFAVSADAKMVYVGAARGTIHVYDRTKGRETASFVAHPRGGPQVFDREGVQAAALSPDGQTLYSSGDYGGLCAWDLRDAKPAKRVLDAELAADQIIVSPDGTRLAAATSNRIVERVRMIDPRTGASEPKLPGHANFIVGLEPLPDGTLMTTGLDRTARWWDAATGRELRQQRTGLNHNWLVASNITPGGRGVVGLDDHFDLVHLDVASGRRTTIAKPGAGRYPQVHGFNGPTLFLQPSERRLQQLDSQTGAHRQNFELPPAPQAGRPPQVRQAVVSPDGRDVVILSTGYDRGYRIGQISFHDGATGALRRRWQTGEARFDCAAFSPDGVHLLAGGLSQNGLLTGGPVDDPLPLAAGSALVLFHARSGEPIRTFAQGSQSVSTLAFTPDSAFFSAAQTDGSIGLYELSTGRSCRVLRGHRNRVAQLAFTDRGRRLVSVSHDMTGLVWDVSLANLAKPAELDAERTWAALAAPEWEIAGGAVAALARNPGRLVEEVRSRMRPAELDSEAVAKLVAQLGLKQAESSVRGDGGN